MPKNLFLELETSNFGCSHVFLRPLKWRGQILPYVTFRIQKPHISGKIPGKIHKYQIMSKWQMNWFSKNLQKISISQVNILSWPVKHRVSNSGIQYVSIPYVGQSRQQKQPTVPIDPAASIDLNKVTRI